MKTNPHDALIVVDLQNDFVTGSLAVPGAQDIVPRIVRLAHEIHWWPIATRDWHRPDHPSFVEQGGPWPAHCVAWTWGSEYAHPGLRVYQQNEVRKGFNDEAYSGFAGTDLDLLLKYRDLHRLFVCGLATDYCVKATALDAIKLGYDVYLLQDCVSGVEFETTADALLEMARAGVRLINTGDLE